MNSKDNVATALSDLSKTIVTIAIEGKEKDLEIVEPIPFGQKFSIRKIAKGENIVKYGEVIGEATKNIRIGALVHTRNVRSKRA